MSMSKIEMVTEGQSPPGKLTAEAPSRNARSAAKQDSGSEAEPQQRNGRWLGDRIRSKVDIQAVAFFGDRERAAVERVHELRGIQRNRIGIEPSNAPSGF